jgi:hypothetical protein
VEGGGVVVEEGGVVVEEEGVVEVLVTIAAETDVSHVPLSPSLSEKNLSAMVIELCC